MVKQTEGILTEQKDIMLIQPNNVTFGQYNITEWQENILTLLTDNIQAHVTKEKSLPTDLFNQPYIEIPCDAAGGRNNKAKVIKETKELMKKTFTFRWVHPNIHKTVETTGVLITTIHNVINSNNIILTINSWAIPFLLYYGLGVGGTRYSKQLALSLKGNYTKRIYKMLCSQRDRITYHYSITQFRKDFEISETATNTYIERKILQPSCDRIKESSSDVWFDFELICKKKIAGRKPKADCIVFKIHTSNPNAHKGQQSDYYIYIYRWMQIAMDYPTTSVAVDATNKIIDDSKLELAVKRIEFFDAKHSSGEMSKDHVKNAILKYIREEFQINFTRTKESKDRRRLR